MRADTAAVDLHPRHALQSFGERLRRRRGYKYSRVAVDHGFERPASRERDDRTPAGLRLEGHDSEILLARHEHGGGATVFVAKLRVRQPAEERHIRSGTPFEKGALGPIA